jgi:hypothetical protein
MYDELLFFIILRFIHNKKFNALNIYNNYLFLFLFEFITFPEKVLTTI